MPPGLRQYAQVTGGGGGGGVWPMHDTHSLRSTAAHPLLSQCLVLTAMKQRPGCSEQHRVHAQAFDRAGLAAASAAALAHCPAPTCSRLHLGGRRRDIHEDCWEAGVEWWVLGLPVVQLVHARVRSPSMCLPWSGTLGLPG